MDIQHLLTFKFKSLLTQNVAMTSKILPNLDEDERLIRMLSELDKRYTGADYTDNNTDVVRPEQVKPLKDKGAFPLCMRSMQTALEKTHHLKYKARLQYGLFLKGIGLSMDDALRFFRGEFTQSHVDADKFDKEYTYGIRYVAQCFCLKSSFFVQKFNFDFPEKNVFFFFFFGEKLVKMLWF